MTSGPEVSVIVPVRDDPRIDQLLGTLAAQKGAPAFEVFIGLDGASRRPRIPEGLAAETIDLPPGGPYAARNAAARRCRGQIVLFTDSDCLCAPDWIAKASRLFEDPRLKALQGSSQAAGGGRLSRSIQLVHEAYVESHAASGYRFFCNTRNFGIRRELLERLPFLENHLRGADGMYGRALDRAGIPLRYEPSWAVLHRHPTSRFVFARQMYRQGLDGARWQRSAGVDLFGDGRDQAGPGGWLRRRVASSRQLAAVAPAGLGLVTAALGTASLVLPFRGGDRAFAHFARAAHLAGRLRGESER